MKDNHSPRGPDNMSPPAAPTVSRVESQHSRELIRDSRALIASAQELIRQSQWTISQQTIHDCVRLVPADHPL